MISGNNGSCKILIKEPRHLCLSNSKFYPFIYLPRERTAIKCCSKSKHTSIQPDFCSEMISLGTLHKGPWVEPVSVVGTLWAYKLTAYYWAVCCRSTGPSFCPFNRSKAARPLPWQSVPCDNKVIWPCSRTNGVLQKSHEHDHQLTIYRQMTSTFG